MTVEGMLTAHLLRVRHWAMLDIYRAHLRNPRHNPKRWVLTAITEEETDTERQSTMPCLQQGVVKQGTVSKFIKFYKRATPIPGSMPPALQTWRKQGRHKTILFELSFPRK